MPNLLTHFVHLTLFLDNLSCSIICIFCSNDLSGNLVHSGFKLKLFIKWSNWSITSNLIVNLDSSFGCKPEYMASDLWVLSSLVVFKTGFPSLLFTTSSLAVKCSFLFDFERFLFASTSPIGSSLDLLSSLISHVFVTGSTWIVAVVVFEEIAREENIQELVRSVVFFLFFFYSPKL